MQAPVPINTQPGLLPMPFRQPMEVPPLTPLSIIPQDPNPLQKPTTQSGPVRHRIGTGTRLDTRDENPKYVDLEIVVESPTTFRDHPVANRVLAFRGKYWHSGNAEATKNPAFGDALIFPVRLFWGLRPRHSMEELDDNPDNLYTEDPTRVFLEFHSITKEKSEHRFATSFAITELYQSEPQTGFYITASNNNTLMNSPQINAAAIPQEYKVHIRFNPKMPIPAYDSLLDGKTAYDVGYLDDTLMKNSQIVANWTFSLIQTVSLHPSPFRNIRTFIRTPLFSPAFTHLPSLWYSHTSPLPIEVPLYMLLNALMINRVTLSDLHKRAPTLTGFDTNRILRTIRDAFMGFTMCKIEGHYQADTLYGIDADDQPFVDGYNFDETVFSRDDCEGRVQQGVMLANAFKKIADFTHQDIIEHIQFRKNNLNIQLLAGLDERTLLALVKTASTVAWLLDTQFVTFHMCVGEASFAKLADNKKHQAAKKYVGHSFASLIFTPTTKPKYVPDWLQDSGIVEHIQSLPAAMQIVEATGWMDEYENDSMKKIYKQYTEYVKQHMQVTQFTPGFRSVTTIEDVDRMYCFIYMIDDKLVFRWNTEQSRFTYGASPSHFVAQNVILLTVKEFHQMLQESLTKPFDQRHPLYGQLTQQLNQAPTDALRMAAAPEILQAIGPAIKTQDEIVERYADYIHPPPVPTPIMDQRMAKWAPITMQHLKNIPAKRAVALVSDGKSKTPVPNAWQHHSHPFMLSHIDLVVPPDA